MVPHAKYIATYATPFWREQGLSGEARSAIGPLGEIYDATMPGGSAALFGFFNIPAATATSGAWSARFTGIASEWLPQFPGYVSGAIEAAGLGVEGWLGIG